MFIKFAAGAGSAMLQAQETDGHPPSEHKPRATACLAHSGNPFAAAYMYVAPNGFLSTKTVEAYASLRAN